MIARLFFAGRDRRSTFFVVQMMVVLSFCLATILSLSGVWLPVGWMISMLPGPLCLGTARGLWRCWRVRRAIRRQRGEVCPFCNADDCLHAGRWSIRRDWDE